MIGFDAWVEQGDGELDLEVGALLVARDAYPELDVAAEVGRLDELAATLPYGDLSQLGPEEAATAVLAHVFRALGFRGNQEAYGDPRNSYLNEVVSRRLGIPITLALVVMGVARRHGLRASGVSFPGHFLVRVERLRGGPIVIDPFFGRTLAFHDLQTLLRKTAGPGARLRLEHLAPASTRGILVRILQNLRAAHVARGDLPRALLAASHTVSLVPGEAWAFRDRGMLQARLGAPGGARADLERYLELSPDAGDAEAVRQALQQVPQRPLAH